ncbi:TPR end-of-group domain-containing protein [Nannocystis exedens]|nr:tetratricopeptide repeat protein [Nannocystis exedens]
MTGSPRCKLASLTLAVLCACTSHAPARAKVGASANGPKREVTGPGEPAAAPVPEPAAPPIADGDPGRAGAPGPEQPHGDGEPAGPDPTAVDPEPKANLDAGEGLKIQLGKEGDLRVSDGHRSAPITTGGDVDALNKVTNLPEGQVKIRFETTCGEERELVFTRPALLARVANAAGLRAHRKKDYATAAAAFVRATKLDPDFDLAATNLACALALQGKTAEAIAALKPWIAREPVKMYAKILADDELAALREAPEIVALRAAKPGTAKLAGDVAIPAPEVFHAPERGLFAAVRQEQSWGSSDGTARLEVFDRTGKQAAELLLIDWADAEDGDCGGICVRTASRARIDGRVAVADRLLRDLGFVPLPGAEVGQTIASDDDASKMRFTKAKLALVLREEVLHVMRGGKSVARQPDALHLLTWAVHSAELGVVVYSSIRPGAEGCEGTDPTALGIVAVP